MPTYKDITMSLVSQYDVLKIPEFAPPSQSPSSDGQIVSFEGASLVHPTLPIVTVYIPTYPSSTFWLSYSIDTSSPTLQSSPPVPFYYFKLFVNGKHIVSWGCGAEDEFRGKTMFGIFRSQDGAGALERRVLTFEEEENVQGAIELKVFRAKARGRVRIEQDTVPRFGGMEGAAVASGSTGSVALNHAGSLPFRHPKRFFNYYLLDAVDHPHAVFRYLYRSWDALSRLGITIPNPSNSPSPHSSRSSSPSNDPDLSAKELRLKGATGTVAERLTSNNQDATTRSVTEQDDSRTKPLPPTPTSSPRSQSAPGRVRDHSGSSRPRSFPTTGKPSPNLQVDTISPPTDSSAPLETTTLDLQAHSAAPQPQPSATSQELAHDFQTENTSPRPKRVSSLLGPPTLFPGALYPIPPASVTHHRAPSPCPSPTKASFSNTVSLLMASPSRKTSNSSARSQLQASETSGTRPTKRSKSPSKFKIAEFLVRRDDDSKGSRHSVGKRKTGQRPTNTGSAHAVSEFGMVGTDPNKSLGQDVGGGKENNVLEGVGTMPRNVNIWKEKVRLGGKRKKAGKMIALAESTNER